MTEQPEILKDYTIFVFLDRGTWRIRYRVDKQPIENHPYFEHPYFDTWDEARYCVMNLREYPKNYATTADGKWVEVANI